MAGKVIVPIEGACSTHKRATGFQFVKYDGVCEAVGSFGINSGGAMKDMGELVGKFVVGQSFKTRGCKLCGNVFLYQCCDCKKFVCYDGKERRDATCPICGKTSSVPATKDERIVMSTRASSGGAEIIFAMDVSGSMEGARLEETKQGAIRNFIRNFQGCRMAVVTFGNFRSSGATVRTEVDFTTDTARVERTISDIEAQGLTPSPLPHIISNFSQFMKGQGRNRYVVIFTDGAWDEGNHIADAETIKRAGIKIIAIGCAGADTGFLARIASPGASIVTSDGKIGEAFASATKIVGQG